MCIHHNDYPCFAPGFLKYSANFCRIIEQLRSESTSTDHLVQPPFSKQGQLDHIARDSAQLGFEYH